MTATGCMATELEIDADVGAEDLGSGAGALVSMNALSFNALSFNALSFNALSFNALSFNALESEATSALQDPGEGGDLFRTLVRYTVSCALTGTQSFSFSWTDGAGTTHEEVYPGQLGLAAAWGEGALDAVGKQMVSACLAARTNRYGVSVVISMRSHEKPLRHDVAEDELDAYAHVEGAFWGNLFAETPCLRACYHEPSVPVARSAQRDCAAGQLDGAGGIEDCGMIEIVGSCQDLCGGLHPPGQYYKDCDDPDSGRTRNVVTTALE
ncbi:hypothetical protein [Sorangium cellulosum]|nr:hypothetical protein [Sorangium cellulosum]